MYRVFIISILVLLSRLISAQVTDDRVALIIGNSDYLSGALKNTVNDARSMARALRQSGFEVMLHENVSNKDELKRTVRSFGDRLQNGSTGLVYYAGHGLQVNGYNYLVPVNAIIQSEEEVEYECLDAGFILALMEARQTRMNIVILDACRNNPFARSFRDSRQGLVGMTAPTGTLIAFATAPGSVASDGAGVNGLYTQELLKQINTPGLKVEDVFKNVRRNVVVLSEGDQTPWESSSLIGDFYFNLPEAELQAMEAVTSLDLPEKLVEADKVVNSPVKKDLSTDELIPYPYQLKKTDQKFRWRAKASNTYFLEFEGRDVSSETINILRGDDLHVYHEKTGQLFILKSYLYRMDNIWRRGNTYR